MNKIAGLIIYIGLCFSSGAFSERVPPRQSMNDITTQTVQKLSSGYYTIIGAYALSKEDYAQRYMEKVKKMGFETGYGLNNRGSLYFVYISSTQNYKAAIANMRETRKNQEFSEAWVYVAQGDGSQTMKDKDATTDVAVPADQQKSEKEMTNEKADTDANKEATETEDEVVDVIVTSEETSLEMVKTKPKKIESLADVNVLFNLQNARNYESVKGEVQLIDAERSKLLGTVKSDESTLLTDPNNGTGRLTLICDVFGYRKTQKEINYYHPLKDTVNNDIALIDDNYVVNFDLVRYHSGDIVVMYNVYFYVDAAVMLPDSKYEVNSLLEMMQENPNYAIRIHGHTNGNSPGKIISMGDSKSYFALSDDNKEGMGSAKQLSEKRAELIKSYLVDNGIAEDRVEVKAWGGKRMLYDKLSSRANENVRVEIEILSE